MPTKRIRPAAAIATPMLGLALLAGCPTSDVPGGAAFMPGQPTPASQLDKVLLLGGTGKTAVFGGVNYPTHDEPRVLDLLRPPSQTDIAWVDLDTLAVQRTTFPYFGSWGDVEFWATDGRWVLYYGEDAYETAYDLETGREVRTPDLDVEAKIFDSGRLVYARFDDPLQLISTRSGRATVFAYDLESGQETALAALENVRGVELALRGDRLAVRMFRDHPDGAAGPYEYASEIQLHDLVTGAVTIVAADSPSNSDRDTLQLAGESVVWLEQSAGAATSEFGTARLMAWQAATATAGTLLELPEQEIAKDWNGDGRLTDWRLHGVGDQGVLLWLGDLDPGDMLGVSELRFVRFDGRSEVIADWSTSPPEARYEAKPQILGDYVIYRDAAQGDFVVHDVASGVERRTPGFAD